MPEESSMAIHRFVRPIDGHPIPFDQEEIDAIFASREPNREPPHVDVAHEDYVETIAEWGEWHVFRPHYPFGPAEVTFWNREFGEAFQFRDEEGSWHHIVNLLAEIVESEGDCRDADYSDSLMQSGSYNQSCEECGNSWSVG